MSSSSSSSSEDDHSQPENKSAFIVKKPHFLRRARTLPYELRLLKQRQHNRRKELEKRQRDEIDIKLSVIEMELSELNQILSEDVDKAIRQELLLKYNISTVKPNVKELANEIYLGSISAEKQECDNSNADWEEHFVPVTECKEIDADETAFMISTCGDGTLAPSTSAGPSCAWQESHERPNRLSTFEQTKEKSPDMEVKSPDIEVVEVKDDEEDEDYDIIDDNNDDDEVTIVQEVNHRKLKNKTAYERYREILELWNDRVSRIKYVLSQKRQSEQYNTSSWRIRNLKNLLQYVREIEDLLLKPNIMRDEKHYAQLQARVSITKFMEVCGFEQFNYLDKKSILTLRQADKEIAAFQYEWWTSKLNAEK